MPAVIQKLFTPPGATLPDVLSAARVDDMFAGHLWEWHGDRDRAFVFPTWEQADAQARELGDGAYAVIRPVPEKRVPSAEECGLPVAETAPLRGVSPAAMAAGSTKERIAGAKRNRKVAQERKRTAEDLRRVYERRVSPGEAYERLEERHLD